MGISYNNSMKSADRMADNRPIIGGLAKEGGQIFGGIGEGIAGVFKGNKNQMKSGLRHMGEGIASTLTLGALGGVNKGIKQQYFGGSQEQAQMLQDRANAGIATGQGYVNSGADRMDTAANMSNDDRTMAQNLSHQGQNIVNRGMQSQDQALNNSIANAGQYIGSQAEQQMRQANQANTNNMMAQAAQARGGNQAAAMRGAQAQASNNAIATNQQTGMLRLQEAQDRKNSMIQAQQNAATQMGARASMGINAQTQGQQLAQGATQTLGNIGNQLANTGNQNLGQYLNAQTEQNKAQLNFDLEKAKSDKKGQGGILGLTGKVIGSVFGKK